MKILFSKPEPVVVEVLGEPQNFYPISVKTVTKLRGIARPVGQALATLFAGNEDLVTRKVDDQQGADKSLRRVTEIGAVNAEVVKERNRARQDAVSTLIDTLLSDPASRILAEIIVDSMRDTFEKRPTMPSELDAIMEQIPADALPDIFKGIMEANKKLFAPLKERAADVSAALQSKLRPVPQPDPYEV